MVKIFIEGNMGNATITIGNLIQEQLDTNPILNKEVNESLTNGVNSNDLHDGEEITWAFAKTK